MIHAITVLFLTNVLLANSQLCSLDYTIKCHFKYKSHKNCNRIGRSCDSFRVLEWMNITDDQKTCYYNSGSLVSQSFEVDGYSICSSVGPLTRPGTIGENCYCSANGIVELSKRIRSTGSVAFGELPMPTSSPTLAPTGTYIPTNFEAYFTSLCPDPKLVYSNFNPETGLTLRKCSLAEYQGPLVSTKSYIIVPSGGLQFGNYQHIYYKCSGEGATISRVSNSEVIATLICDNQNRYVNLPQDESKMFGSSGYIELIAHN